MKTYQTDVEAVDALHLSYKRIREEISQVIIGQDDVVKSVLISIFSNGHCLLVGVPGLAKTLLVQTVAQVLDLSYNRIQFTPDLMPSDIIGSEILGEDRTFKFIRGPIFSNIILADEINRTPPKTQAALLEAMQEKVVTVGGQTHRLPQPFFVLATQNPIEQEGTYPLPEAQLDRFMFNVFLTYPSFEEELQVVRNTTANRNVELKKILNAQEISYFQQLVRNIPITDNVLEYAVSLAAKTRPGTASATDDVNKFLSWGAGPRASQFLVLGAKCHAAISGKYSPDKEDVMAVAESILRHRIVKNYKAEAEGISTEMIISKLL
ncbi:MAG: AAA family ATPase [Sphingobacteriales bacterium 17-39-43]|uniref:AAA family ATPase n=1 Tax=Daejeonella sp. TaxID=2805397 RepID=UPI000BDDB56E|nr:MoxR family ATPase [Daejeonella sp.]MCF8453500.1 MoxR family ATPase [Pedobacter sp.]OYZ29211.1 MAG: AAA family ATPase [Sphingobacteriales bacterium 16-39-50]OZA22391.1 MAG: AAA family ATPase [Sphingobacteriales bacterium 17-39-43]HQS04761.1 MoxR family ATPase [Daejeonella sp.]HQS51231.1 MoxR family ATPase [Daejeonella sp.]